MTSAEVPNATVIGWRSTASERNATASPYPAPTIPTATRPALIEPSRGACHDRRATHHHSAPPPRATTTQHKAHTLPIGHTIPAAVTIQLTSAAGTRRTSKRDAPKPIWRTGIRHGPDCAACPAAPDRCRRRRQAGRRW
ncbi:Uncharacterised protein [Mycobacterium tuberculosis]|nr:Uncharacterised protein [Mycobacterium tuberculosis]